MHPLAHCAAELLKPNWFQLDEVGRGNNLKIWQKQNSARLNAERRAAILVCLKASKYQLTPSEIAKQCGLQIKAVQQLLTDMVIDGEIYACCPPSGSSAKQAFKVQLNKTTDPQQRRPGRCY